MASRLIENGDEVLILWVPAHAGIQGNGVADGMAKEAAAGQTHGVPDQVRWQASLPHLARRATERRSGATTQWIRDHVRPKQSYTPPGGPDFRKRGMRKARKSTAQRYYQLMSGHAGISSFCTTECQAPTGWTRASVDVTVEGGSRVITCLRSAGHGPCGRGSERIAGGSTRGHQR